MPLWIAQDKRLEVGSEVQERFVEGIVSLKVVETVYKPTPFGLPAWHMRLVRRPGDAPYRPTCWELLGEL